jgi:diguanylate cyclase (GGDEF)-like protein
MEFPRPEWLGGVKPSEDGEEALKRQLKELEEKHRMLDLEKGLDEWHIEVLEQEHGIDHLTGVATRKAFEAALAQAYDVMGRNEDESRRGARVVTEASVIFIDLDNFKQVNDTLGHQQGDATLKKAASLLRGALREEDMLARYGGDEFVALLVNADEDNAAMVGILAYYMSQQTSPIFEPNPLLNRRK